MNDKEKTHYRKVFKSDHLGVADLEDLLEAKSNLIFTIQRVKQEIGVRVAGKKGNFNIAYFAESIKPLVLNAGNSKVMKTLSGSSFVEDWNNITVQLYIDPTAKFAGEITGGVRINPNPVSTRQKEITPKGEKGWNHAKAAFIRDGNFLAVLEKAFISDKNMELMMREVNDAKVS